MEIGNAIHFSTREEWRAWLAANRDSEPEVWLVSYRKETGVPSVAYNDAVEEALCHGWIDSTRKGMDDKRYAQRFTPRRTGSGFSQTNRERLARLLAAGLVHPAVARELEDISAEAFEIPEDIRDALEGAEGAWEFFANTAPAYQRIRAAYVDHARNRPDEFNKRLRHLVERSAKKEQFGYGIESYF